MVLYLLAKSPPVKVVPLLPPHPTNMTPNLGTLVVVLNLYSVSTGVILMAFSNYSTSL